MAPSWAARTDHPPLVLDDLDRHLRVVEEQRPARQHVVVGVGQLAEDVRQPGLARDALEVAQRDGVLRRRPTPGPRPGLHGSTLGVSVRTDVPHIGVEAAGPGVFR